MKIPKLELSEYGDLEGEVILNCWKGYQSRLGDYADFDSPKPSLGKASLIVIRSNSEEKNPKLEKKEKNALHYLIKNQSVIKESILNYLFERYSELQEDFGYDDDEKEEYMPNLNSIVDFKNLIGLSTVYILSSEKEDSSFIGFGFGCSWDDEHGLGFMTHKNKIIEMGGIPTAFGA